MRIKKITQTPFISYEDNNMLYIEVADWDGCNPFGVELSMNGTVVYQTSIFFHKLSVMVPCCSEKTECTITLTPFEDLPVEKTFTLLPAKKWKIPLLYSSHEDLGYCAYIDKLHFESYEYLKVAMDLCEKYDGFRYMIEHYWWLDAFDTYAAENEKIQLKKLMAEKRIELNAIHSGVHTSWENAEMLVRGMYFGCRDAEEKYGVRPECAFFTDLSGASWSTVTAYSQMGIRYMADFSNSFRNNEEDLEFPPVFWWQDKSGENKVLFWYQRSYRPHGLTEIWCDTKRQYPEGEFFFDQTKAYRTEEWLTEKIGRMKDCVYDILPLSFYDDRERPTTMLLTVCEEMNKRWKYPQFRMEVPSVFMREIAEKYGNEIPVYSGNISDQWADFATIAPQWMKKRRAVSRMLFDAEYLSCIKAVTGKHRYERKPFTRAVWNMSCFDEHCWATSSKHPQSMHRYNMNKVKRGPVEEAYSELGAVLNEIAGRPEAEMFSVTNTIPQGYRGGIRVNQKEAGEIQVVPADSEHQILPDGSVITSPIYFEYAGVCNFAAVVSAKGSAEYRADVIETAFYRVRVNDITQQIVSIYDKERKQELLDRDSDFELGQFIYMNSPEKTAPPSGYEIPKKQEFRVYEGDVAYVLTQKGYEEQSGAVIKTQFIFYKYEKNIDIDISYENAAGMLGDFYDRYKKNYFLAFPFKVEDPVFYTELPCGEMNETERIELNASDFAVTQNWIAVENEIGGIAVYSEDMPVFHMGKIKYNHFEKGFREEQGHVYLYASSNRCNNLIYTSLEECCASYHLSILPYAGSHKDVVPKWSTRKEHKPIIGKAVEKDMEYMSIDKPNMKLVGMKQAEDQEHALIIRMTETAGEETDGVLKLFFCPEKACYVSGTEKELETIPVKDQFIPFHAKPFSYVTLKVTY